MSEFKTNQRLKFRVSDRDGSHERSATGTVEGWTVGTRPGVGATDVARVRGDDGQLYFVTHDEVPTLSGSRARRAVTSCLP